MLNNRHHSTLVLEKRKTKEVSPMSPKISAQRHLLDLAKIHVDPSRVCSLQYIEKREIRLWEA